MIALRRLDHVSLRTPTSPRRRGAGRRSSGLTEREPGRLACDDEPFCLELVAGEPGVEHVAYELRRGCSLDDARAHLAARASRGGRDDGLRVTDPEGNRVLVLPYRGRPTTWTSHVRPAGDRILGAPRKLGHVNFLTGAIARAGRLLRARARDGR